MKKNLVLILIVTFVLSIAGTAIAGPFADVPAKHWAYDAVSKLSKAGLVDGYGDGTFRGDRTITRYEMAMITAKAMERSDKADAANKALINKLASEFSTELSNLGVRVAKVEGKTKTWVSGGDFRARFHTNSPKTPGTNRLNGGDQFDWRGRVAITGQLNEHWKANARFTTTWSNRFGNADPAGFSTTYFDIFNMTGTNVMGVDSVRLGRNWFSMGNGLMNKSAAVDGLWLSEKMGKTDVATFIGNIKSDTATNTADSNPNTFGMAQLSWKPNKDLKFGASYFMSDIAASGSVTGLLADSATTRYNSSKGYTVFASQKFSGMTLLGEYVGTSLSGAANMPDSPSGWAIQLSNGKGPGANAFFGNIPLTRLDKVGETAWLIGYRRVESGATPSGLGGFDQLSPSRMNTNHGVFLHGTDNVKGLMIVVDRTLDKNLTANIKYEDLKVVNRALTPSLTSDNLDRTVVATINYWF